MTSAVSETHPAQPVPHTDVRSAEELGRVHLVGIGGVGMSGLASLRELLREAHHARPQDLPEMAMRVAGQVGAEALMIYVVDHQQRELRPLRGVTTPDREPVAIDLRPVFDRCYDEGGFARLMKYATRAPDPPLTADQKAWADAVLKEKGLLP